MCARVEEPGGDGPWRVWLLLLTLALLHAGARLVLVNVLPVPRGGVQVPTDAIGDSQDDSFETLEGGGDDPPLAPPTDTEDRLEAIRKKYRPPSSSETLRRRR